MSRRPTSGLTGWTATPGDENRWFSWVSLNGTTLDDGQQQNFVRRYSSAAGAVDTQIGRVLNALREAGKLDNTVVIVTAGRGMPLNPQHEQFGWSREQLQVPGDPLARHAGAGDRDADG